ncbi:MAG TPA: PH domain-containing protein [Patescibacteria group bacterium]|nr:PH domain-containing protein [Patescibacteria group bacterium]
MPDVFISPEDVEKEKSEEKNPQKTPSQAKGRSGHKVHIPLWASYGYYPKNVKFIDQEPEENVILFLRAHPITNLGWILIGVVMIFAPLFLGSFPLLDFLPIRFQVVAILGWYLITMVYMFEKFLSWFFNVNIITDRRVVDVDFTNLIYREITDANLNKIQDVTVSMGGVFRSIFNFGTILVQTAGEKNFIDFIDIPKPDMVAGVLSDLRLGEEHKEKVGNKL